jgi:uncharacterized SAM-binding protein YcdF (DUF218 family)
MRFFKACWFCTKWSVVFAGITTFLLLFGALTSLPGRAYSWLSDDADGFQGSPDIIVVLGGGGIPSESGLTRCWYGADLAQTYSNAVLIAALPDDKGKEISNVERMRGELVLRGISETRVQLETQGLNTHQQAANLYARLTAEGDHPSVMLITSEYHLRRALKTFRKAGFEKVTGMPAHSRDVDADLGPLVNLRYTFWNNLEAYIMLARECTAMSVYKLKGWM